MEFALYLFQPDVLVFSVPIFFSLSIWTLALIGLFDFHIFHIDLHLDGSHDLHGLHGHFGGNLLQMLGFGMVPFSLVITLILFFFGWAGLVIHDPAQNILLSINIASFLAKIIIPLISLIFSIFLTAIIVRPLRPFFRDYGKPGEAKEIIGKLGTLKTTTISKDFGTVSVKLDSGIMIDVSARTISEDNNLTYGDEVLVIEYDPKNSIYYVEPLKKLENRE